VFTAVGSGFIVLVVVALFLFVARRVFRLALKLALVGAVVVLLLGVAAFGWWRGWFGPSSSTQHPAPQSNQRTNSNRRSR
jgi:multisubunit Na+/H+ antiporter MnhC subunit